MQFQLDDSEKPTKTSLGMYSKEGEYVTFSEPCDCSGQVTHASVSQVSAVTHHLPEQPL